VIDANVTYEPLAVENLPDVLAIEHLSFPEPWSKRLFLKEMRRPDSYFMVFRLNAEVIGYGGFWWAAGEIHITNIAVHPAYRRRGYGGMILEHLLNTAVCRHATMATLEVRETNLVAISLYEKFGFRPVAIQREYYSDSGEDAVIMLKDDLGSFPRE